MEQFVFKHPCVSLPFREQPIFSARAHVFQIDPNTKRNWIPASKHAVTVSFFYDANRNVYRIISVGGTKVRRKKLVMMAIVLTAENQFQWILHTELNELCLLLKGALFDARKMLTLASKEVFSVFLTKPRQLHIDFPLQ